jgi:hypothetical protein
VVLQQLGRSAAARVTLETLLDSGVTFADKADAEKLLQDLKRGWMRLDRFLTRSRVGFFTLFYLRAAVAIFVGARLCMSKIFTIVNLVKVNILVSN